MAVYSVTYDLNTEGQDYDKLIKHLESYTHVKYQKSAWLIKSNLSPQELYVQLKPFIDSNDFILIITVTKTYYGFLPKDKWPMIEQLFK